MELILIVILTVVLTPVVEFTTGAPRVILGAIFLVLFPGYTLIAALFPRKESLQVVERLALSLVLSFAIVPLAGLILNYTPWGIRLEPIFAALAIFIFIASLVALVRRRKLPQGERFEPRIRIVMPRIGSMSRLERAVCVLLVLAILGAAGALFYVVATPEAEESFTDFYLLGSEGLVADYPRELIVGEQAQVTVGVVNHEHQYTNYRVEVLLGGEEIQETGPFELADEEDWQEIVTFVPDKAGDDQKIEFFLYKGVGAEPYLTLYLWLDVIEAL